jgi:hypothetical protein
MLNMWSVYKRAGLRGISVKPINLMRHVSPAHLALRSFSMQREGVLRSIFEIKSHHLSTDEPRDHGGDDAGLTAL